MELSAAGKLTTLMLTKPPVVHSFPISGSTHFDNDYYQEEDVFDIDSMMAQGRYIVQA